MKALSLFLTGLLVFHPSLQAGPIPAQQTVHVVSIPDLRDEVSARTAERASNIREVQTLLRHQAVKDRLGHLYDLEKVAVAVPTLDDETLSRLARESEPVNEQFRAGLGTGTIIILVVVIVVVLLIVAALTLKAEVESVRQVL